VLSVRPNSSVRGFGATAGSVGNLPLTQNQAILIVAVIAASISWAIAMVSLRWFLSMKRNFCHHLILMLIVSDSFKALWCFLTLFDAHRRLLLRRN
jgi:G protein-coupled glucose receptor regulating Gpa2